MVTVLKHTRYFCLKIYLIALKNMAENNTQNLHGTPNHCLGRPFSFSIPILSGHFCCNIKCSWVFNTFSPIYRCAHLRQHCDGLFIVVSSITFQIDLRQYFLSFLDALISLSQSQKCIYSIIILYHTFFLSLYKSILYSSITHSQKKHTKILRNFLISWMMKMLRFAIKLVCFIKL